MGSILTLRGLWSFGLPSTSSQDSPIFCVPGPHFTSSAVCFGDGGEVAGDGGETDGFGGGGDATTGVGGGGEATGLGAGVGSGLGWGVGSGFGSGVGRSAEALARAAGLDSRNPLSPGKCASTAATKPGALTWAITASACVVVTLTSACPPFALTATSAAATLSVAAISLSRSFRSSDDQRALSPPAASILTRSSSRRPTSAMYLIISCLSAAEI